MLAFEGSQGVELTDEEAEESARAYDEAQVVLQTEHDRIFGKPHDQNACSRARRWRRQQRGTAKTADEADAKAHVFRDTPSLLGARQAISHAKKPARKPVSVAPCSLRTSHSTHIRTAADPTMGLSLAHCLEL